MPAPATRTWTWTIANEPFEPTYTADATDDGVAYGVWIHGPSGGPGMAGFQTYDELLRDGPHHDAPAEIAEQIRAHASAVLARGGRARLSWTVGLDATCTSTSAPSPAGSAVRAADLSYVSASVRDRTVLVQVFDAPPVVLHDGTLPPGDAKLSFAVGFGRPWPRPDAKITRWEHVVPCPAGVATTVTCLVTPDFGVVTRVDTHPLA